MLYEIDRFLVAFNDDMSTNFDVWKVFTKKINQEPLATLRLKSYKENVDYLRKWFVERYTYVDTLFNSDALYEQGGVESSGGGWWGDWWN
jgi:hypothetical protein